MDREAARRPACPTCSAWATSASPTSTTCSTTGSTARRPRRLHAASSAASTCRATPSPRHAEVTGERDGRRPPLVDLDARRAPTRTASRRRRARRPSSLFDGAPAMPPLPDPPSRRATSSRARSSTRPRSTSSAARCPPVAAPAVGANDIARWAIATYWPEPPPAQFLDAAAAEKGPWGGLVAPRDFDPFAWMPDRPWSGDWLWGMGTEPGKRVLNGGQRNRYVAPDPPRRRHRRHPPLRRRRRAGDEARPDGVLHERVPLGEPGRRARAHRRADDDLLLTSPPADHPSFVAQPRPAGGHRKVGSERQVRRRRCRGPRRRP